MATVTIPLLFGQHTKRHLVDETFATIRSGSGNSANGGSVHEPIGLENSTTSSRYQSLTRGQLIFDTSVLPYGVTITDVKLHYVGLSKSNDYSTDPTLHVCGSTSTNTGSLASGDYQLSQSTSFGSKTYAAFTIGADSITLNASGIASVSTTGLTRFSLRSSYDLNNSAPAWSSSAHDMLLTADRDSYELEVTYTPNAKMETLKDNFDDNSFNTTLWTNDAGTVSETGQQLRFPATTYPVSILADAYYDLEDSHVAVEVVSSGVVTSSQFAYPIFLYNSFSGALSLAIEIKLGVIRFLKYTPGETVVASQTYNSTTHRWVKIREASGTIYADYSTNGIAWNNLGSMATGSYDINYAPYVNFINNSATTRTMIIDNYNEAAHIASASGTIILGGTATRKWVAHREAIGTIVFGGFAIVVRALDTSDVEKKTFIYKVYDEDNNFIGVWDDVIDEPNWSQELNTTGSALTVLLARNSDSLITTLDPLMDNTGASILDNNNFEIMTTVASRNKVGPGSDVNHNYRVDIYVYYGSVDTIDDYLDDPIEDNTGEFLQGTLGAPNGIRRFTGFISEININYGDNENTQVQLMSYGFDLDQYPVVTSGGDTTVPMNSTDPTDMVRTGLDQFALDAGGDSFTTYSEATVEDTGTTPSYTFRANTYKELLETSVKLAPSGWFFYIGLGDNLVRFKPKPSTATHTFYLGKHIKNLNLRSYIGDVINSVIFTGGGDPALYKQYTEVPLAGTRRGLSRLTDSRVTLEASADILSEGEIDEKKSIQYRSTVDILDRQYDIESIELGELIAFRNFDNNVDLITMQVVASNYTPDVITLQLDTLPPSVPRRLEELRKALNAQETLYVPDAPDV